jgi:hypothetical protein
MAGGVDRLSPSVGEGDLHGKSNFDRHAFQWLPVAFLFFSQAVILVDQNLPTWPKIYYTIA